MAATFGQGIQDKRIIETIRSFPPGEFGSDYFDAAVDKFVDISWKVDEIHALALRHEVTPVDLAFFYKEIVRYLMPNPYIRAGSNMVAASLPFYEPFRLAPTLAAIEAESREEDRQEVIVRHAQLVARATWDTHTAARGEADVPRPLSVDYPKGSGCGGASVLVLIAVSTLAAYIILSL